MSKLKDAIIEGHRRTIAEWEERAKNLVSHVKQLQEEVDQLLKERVAAMDAVVRLQRKLTEGPPPAPAPRRIRVTEYQYE